jgi:hypothetical protein
VIYLECELTPESREQTYRVWFSLENSRKTLSICESSRLSYVDLVHAILVMMESIGTDVGVANGWLLSVLNLCI